MEKVLMDGDRVLCSVSILMSVFARSHSEANQLLERQKYTDKNYSHFLF